MIFKSTGGRMLVIPRHGDREVPHKVIKDVQEALNMSRDELIMEL